MEDSDEDDITNSNKNQELTSTSKKPKSNLEEETSSLSSIIFGKQKLTKAEKRFIRYKKALKLIKVKNMKINCVFLNELTKINNKKLKEDFDKEKALLDGKKFLNMVKFHNKIREIINSTDINEINRYIFQNDFTTYNIKLGNPNKINSNTNITAVEKNNNNDNNINNLNIKKNLNQISPIKNFWKLSFNY